MQKPSSLAALALLAMTFGPCAVRAADPPASVFITLGTMGGPIASATRSQPANLLVRGDAAYLIDSGDGAVEQLVKAGYRLQQVKAVFLSHLHIDHTGGLAAVMGLRYQNNPPGQLAIYGPPGTKQLVAGIVASLHPFMESGYGLPGTQRADPADLMDPGAVDDPARGGSKLVCVRTCDGGFFPLATSARRSGPEGMADMCRALCPNVETKPYTYFSSADIDQAVALDGTPYKALPNALKFRTKFDPTCTCKPADRSWVQALAEAEALLGRSRSDIVVTPEKAEELSRASTAAPKAPPGKTPPGKPGAPAKPEADPTLAIEAAANAKAPTASNDSAGIAANTGGTAKTYGVKDGELRDQGTATGTRKVRIVGPTL